MTGAEFRLFRSLACLVAAVTCIGWFTTMSLTHQVDDETMQGYTIEFGWPFFCFAGEVDDETFRNAGHVQTALATRELSVRWGRLLANLALAAILCVCTAMAASRALSVVPRVRLHHCFGMTAFVAWFVWKEKPFFDHKSLDALGKVELLLLVYAWRTTWVFVLAGCLFFVPLMRLIYRGISNFFHRPS